MTDYVPGQVRKISAWLIIIASVALWYFPSDLVPLIVKQRAVLFGRYSEGHFAALFVLTLLWWGMAALLLSSLKTFREMVFVALSVSVSSGITLFVALVVTGFISMPNYIETRVDDAAAGKKIGIDLKGVTRHRSPNESFDLDFVDVPEQARSYPGAPPGYGTVPIVMKTDAYGFRNRDVQAQYDIVAVGDSFVAGSHVSDEQMWTQLLSQTLAAPIYNLGVSGSAPDTYLNNLAVLGLQFKPKTVLFMIYEGNDFRFDAVGEAQAEQDGDDQPVPVAKRTLGQKIGQLVQASPIVKGIRRLGSDVFAHIGKDAPVPDYAGRMGWMPVAVQAGNTQQYYSFKPKRLLYLAQTAQEFRQSTDWLGAQHVFSQLLELSKLHSFRVVMVYAPSTPHVVMPLVRDTVPADQLLAFARYGDKGLSGDPQQYKDFFYDNIDSQENTFMQWCADKKVECVSLTKPLQAAAAAGVQVFYTYDQHWTPDGNRVVADVVSAYLKQ